MIKKYLYIILGTISFVIGGIGALIPVLPTTPFLLLAGFFFTRSSEKFTRWLHGTGIYQFYAADYQATGTIPRSKKKKILINIYVLMGFSIYFAPLMPVKIILFFLTIFLTYMLMVRIPDGKESQERIDALEERVELPQKKNQTKKES